MSQSVLDPGATKALSKTLSWILRHHAVELGLQMRPDGFVSLDSVLALPQLVNFKPRPTLADVQHVVDNNDKKRFGLIQEGSQWFIRAHQGHSGDQKEVIDDEELLVRIEDASKYPVCVHGTTREAWNAIQKTGLNRMKRKHIHFSSKDFGAADMISGMRSSSQVLIHINLDQAIKDGYKFYVSSNEVILSEGIDGVIPPKYFAKVEMVQGKKRVAANSSPASAVAAVEEKKEPVVCPFDYLLILDFEATCEKDQEMRPQEIIEFPIVVINTHTLKETARLHHYVRPVHHPQLTNFCTELTGVQQSTVDAAQPFPSVWASVLEFLEVTGFVDKSGKAIQTPGNKWSFVTCGDWDLKTMLPAQMLTSKLDLPAFVNSWINIKIIFGEKYSKGKRAGGMTDMLQQLKLPLKGRHHSGIDDCINIAEIARALVTAGANFYSTTVRQPDGRTRNERAPGSNPKPKPVGPPASGNPSQKGSGKVDWKAKK